MAGATFQVGPFAVTLEGDAALRDLAAVPAKATSSGEALTVRLQSDDSVMNEPAEGWRENRCRARGLRLRRDGDAIQGVYMPAKGAVERALRFALQPALLERGFLMLHAATVQLPNGVHLFAAPSGTGKTTLARRLSEAGFPALGDEVALVDASGCTPYPFQPVAPASQLRCQLKALHFLRRGEPSSRVLPAAETAARILGLAMVYEDRPEAAARALDIADSIARKVNGHETHLPNDARATDHLLALDAGAPQ